MDLSLTMERIQRWGLKGGMAILDQGVFSGSNFILNILLARWLLPEDYGAYAFGFAVSMFFLQLIISYILEPMGVLGPSFYSDRLRDYMAAQLRTYFVIVTPVGLLFTISMYLYRQNGGDPLLSGILMMMGSVISLIFLPWLLRRTFYILQNPDISAKGSMLYCALLIPLIYFAKQLDVLSGQTSFLVVAISALIGSVFLSAQLGWNVISKTMISVRSVFRENWNFGKWLLVSGLLITIGGQAQVFLSGALLGIKESGIVSAMQAPSQPMTLCITALSALVTPSLAADFAKTDFFPFRQKAIWMTVMLTLFALTYEGLLLFFRAPLESILYAGKFSSHASLIPIWGLTPLIMAAVSGMQYSLQAAQRPYAILIASLFWVPSTFGMGAVMALKWGLWGIAVSTVIGYLVLASALALLYWKWIVPRIKG